MPPKVKLPPDQLELALEALRQATGLEARMLLAAPGGNGRPADVVLELRLEGREYRVAVHAQTTLDRVEALRLVKDRLDDPGLLFAPYITDVIARKCRELDVPFIDAVGNAYLRFPGLYVFITGQKPKRGITTVAGVRGVGTATALRMVFALLCRPQLLNVPYREITDATGVALGAVGRVFQDLYKMGYLTGGRPKLGRRRTAGQRKRNRRILEPFRLFEEWVTNYPIKLRPKLNPRRFRVQDAGWWKTAQLNELGAVWGGEVAADHLTNYLQPATATIYIPPERDPNPLTQLVERHRLRAELNGNIDILEKFWDFPADPQMPDVAPPILVYADLVATLEPRNLETAKLVREKYIDDALRAL